MVKKEFNVLEWLNKPKQQKTTTTTKHTQGIENKTEAKEIEIIIQKIEARSIDIASAYSDWRDIGFAFADAFGESGRDYFHRVSKYYADYLPNECDKQFDNCLRANGHGVTIKTFFFHAKQAGIDIATSRQLQQLQCNEPVQTQLPTFPDSVFENLPEFLQKVVKISYSKEERDILLLGSIVSLGAYFEKLYGIYDGTIVYPNLYVFITAPPSAGKGKLKHCQQLIMPIHEHLREETKVLKQQHNLAIMENAKKKSKGSNGENPGKPPQKALLIPANNSATGIFQLLSQNEGGCLIFETEGDTMAQTLKTDYGNYSDGLRKAFHHERISYFRRTDSEFVNINYPRLSSVFSGTPKQVSSLIPNAENGLFSRFIFYFMNTRPECKDVFENDSENGLDDYFNALGNDFFKFYQTLSSHPKIQFCLNLDQQEQFFILFKEVHSTYLSLQGLDYIATIRRMGLITFRIAMVLSALRIMETGDVPTRIICEEQDFQTSLEIWKILLKHSSKVFSELLPEDKPLPRRRNQKEKFLDGLPANFNRQNYLTVAASLFISDKTAEGYITEFFKKGLIHRDKLDHYINPNAKSSR